jgi:hypothetical protein
MGAGRLDYLDQATFLSQQATGRAQLTQLVWVYERPLDHVGLKQFHQNFGYGLAGRRIERSPLPFGRHRWVSSVGPASDIDVAETARSRRALSEWIDERSQLPIDPESGPGWHLGVLPMTDGSWAVSLVGSHCLFDGVGFLQNIAEAVRGQVREVDYPAPQSRSRMRGVTADAAQTLRDVRSLGGALAEGVKLARGSAPRRGRAAAGRTPVRYRDSEVLVIPAVSVFVDLPDWDRAAAGLGGNSHSLLAAFSAKLGDRLGRCHPDSGTAALLIAISDRTPDDTRANALRFVRVDLDPAAAGSDLAEPRCAIRGALAAVREEPDATFALLPLTPFVPKRAVRRMSGAVFGDLPVSCSNLGDVDPAVGSIDGTAADYVFLRPADQNVSRSQIDSGGGHLVVVSGRVGGRMSIGVVAYQSGAVNTKVRLRELASEVLDGFGLTGQIV